MKIRWLIACGVHLSVLFGQTAWAAVETWNATGGSNQNRWFNSANWNPARTPTDSDIVILPGGTVNQTTIYDAGDVNFQEIRFLNSGYVLNGDNASSRVCGKLWSVQQTSGGVIVTCGFRTVFGNATLSVANAAASLSLNGSVQIVGGATITTQGAGSITMNKLTSDSVGGGISKTGSGTLSIVGANTLSNATLNVIQGTLAVGQSSTTGNYTTNVSAGAAMTGSGVSATTVNRGTISPGGSSTGTLTFDGNLSCPTDAVSSVAIRLGGSDAGLYDTINRLGSADFRGANLSLSLINGYTPPIGASFTICSGSTNQLPVNPFRNLAEGARFALGRYVFSITYLGGATSNTVLVQRIATPVPSIAATSAPGTPFTFKLAGFPGGVMRVESSTDLSTWAFVQNVTLDSQGGFTVAPTVSGPKMFFRATPVEP